MKLNKNKSKGKVHPSPSSSSSSSSSSPLCSSNSNDPISSLNLLLPATILTLISTLSLQDREVLAYMILHSLKSSPVPSIFHDNRKNPKKSSNLTHKSPSFDCDCFDCYTTYWFRWDSSPFRELIHQAIEAFEEHLAKTEQPKKGRKKRDKEKEKVIAIQESFSDVGFEDSREIMEGSPENEVNVAGDSPEKMDEERESVERESEEREGNKQQRGQEHKGLARKMLPDVIGLFNSRLWNLWGPNV